MKVVGVVLTAGVRALLGEGLDYFGDFGRLEAALDERHFRKTISLFCYEELLLIKVFHVDILETSSQQINL
jgi:hypothetical protein